MPSTAPITGSLPGKIRTFLLDHERLIIIVIGAILVWGAYVKITNIIAAHDEATLKQAQIVADAQKQQNAQLAQQVQQDAINLKALEDKLEQQNQQLVNANTQLASALAQRQRSDNALPLPDLGVRWKQLVPSATLVATSTGITVDAVGSHDTVSALEQVPVLQDQLKNETTEKQNDDQIITQQGKSIFDLNGQVTGLNKQIVDNTTVCQAQIKVVKDEARKSKRKWFIIGYIAGFASKAFLSSKGF